jgi:hypothetical protein
MERFVKIILQLICQSLVGYRAETLFGEVSHGQFRDKGRHDEEATGSSKEGG